jgi:integrase/recombinase XerC
MATTQAVTTLERGQNAPSVTDSPSEIYDIWLAGRSASTMKTYGAGLRDFSRFAGVSSPAEALRVLVESGRGHANALLRKYRNALVERELSPASVNVYLAAVRSLVAFAEETGLVDWTLKIAGVKSVSYRNTAGPGLDMVKRMIATVASRGDAKGVRDSAIMILLHDLGLRRAEVLSLDLQHADLGGGKLWILGKGFSERQAVTLTGAAKCALESWIRVRGSAEGPLFVNMAHDTKIRGARLGGGGLYRLVKKAGAAVGVDARPHGLRHGGITVALDVSNGNARKVRKFSRHASIATVQKYDDSREDFAGQIAALVSAAREAV